MATVEFLTSRIEGAKKNITKLEKKLARIEKAQSTNWKENPYYYNESDLKWTTRDLENAKKTLANYESELASTIEKDNSRDVKALNDFLDNWERKAVEFYLSEYPLYVEAVKAWREYTNEWTNWYNGGSWRRLPEDEKKAIYREKNKEYDDTKTQFVNDWSHITQFNHGSLPWEETMRKDIAEEKKRKYDYIIERVNAICGTITDASNLSVAPNGELNGHIVGDRGVASVTTIGAGGYNVGEIVNVRHGQRFHFRVLVREVK